MSSTGTARARSEILGRMRALQDELAQLQALAATHAAGERLPGAYLVLEAAGRRALVPGALAREVLRLVALAPVPRAPAPLVGSFVYRGSAVMAIDLARWLGVAREADVDAHLVVLGAARPFALLADRVAAVVDEPEVAGEAAEADPWQGAGLAAAWCRVGEEVLPLLRLAPFTALLDEVGA
jgi:purine-binding chemotaxis protein CheW